MNWLNFSEPSLRGNCSGLTCGIKTCISVSCPNNGVAHGDGVGINLVISIFKQ